MGNRRWQHLDLRKPAPRAADPPPSPARPLAQQPAASAPPVPSSPRLAHARALYHLRQYADVADEARAVLTEEPYSTEALRLLGLALGHLGEWADAAEALRTALDGTPDDPIIRAALQSAQIRLGAEPLQPTGSETGPGAEMAGAACWLTGQRRLRESQATEAARQFEQAGSLMARWSPVEVRAERVAGCFIAQAVALLLAGDWPAAQRAFSRLEPEVGGPRRTARETRGLIDFARQLYGVAEALPQLDAAERDEALQPLRDLVLNARLHVRFYDGTLPVAMHWADFQH